MTVNKAQKEWDHQVSNKLPGENDVFFYKSECQYDSNPWIVTQVNANRKHQGSMQDQDQQDWILEVLQLFLNKYVKNSQTNIPLSYFIIYTSVSAKHEANSTLWGQMA